MPLDYSKWDKLELSDDEDFECHPNVDKPSMVRWRQADIHRKRRERADKLNILRKEKALNLETINNLRSFHESSKTSDVPKRTADAFGLQTKLAERDAELMEHETAVISKDRDARWGPPEADPIILTRVPFKAILDKVDPSSPSFISSLEKAISALETRNKSLDSEIQKEDEEVGKKTTMDDLKEGFNKTMISKPSSVAQQPPDKKPVSKEGGASQKSNPVDSSPQSAAEDNDEDDDDEDDKITYPPAQAFCDIKGGMGESAVFLRKHPELVCQKYSDMILAEAFRLQLDKRDMEARQAVQQALLLQYCGLLGTDGVSIFFARLQSPQHNARQMFFKDIQETYTRIQVRVAEIKRKQELEEAQEQKALRARLEACRQPDGTIKLPISENPTPEETGKAQYFSTLPLKFQEALLLQDVDAINTHLQTLTPEEGEELVKQCNDAGLLNLEVETE
ncbi:hypothetical protein DFS34DRAFT_40503 [Phlyctochytrium arcticum]|nr:hypothetical protein DFS34DRAFT_40503 [Phlyctochytrium arcticum]